MGQPSAANSPVSKLLRLGYAADRGRRHSMEDAHVMVECLEGSVSDVVTPAAGAVPTTCLLAVSATAVLHFAASLPCQRLTYLFRMYLECV